MHGKYLLDTNAAIWLLSNGQPLTDKLRGENLSIPAIALGELYFGAFKSSHTNENLNDLKEFAAALSILPCDAETARAYGQVKTGIRTMGKPIPDNDMWIAAIAIQHDLVLSTRDGHFNHVQNLQLATW